MCGELAMLTQAGLTDVHFRNACFRASQLWVSIADPPHVRRGDDTVGNHHRAQFCQFEFFELILLLKLDERFPVEQFEATVSQSTVPSLLLNYSSDPDFGSLWRRSTRAAKSMDFDVCLFNGHMFVRPWGLKSRLRGPEGSLQLSENNSAMFFLLGTPIRGFPIRTILFEITLNN